MTYNFTSNLYMITKAAEFSYNTFKPLNRGHPCFLAEDTENYPNLVVGVGEGGGYGPRQGLPRAMCDGLDRMCKQATHAGLIPTFKLSSYFSFASFWLALRLFLDKKLDR